MSNTRITGHGSEESIKEEITRLYIEEGESFQQIGFCFNVSAFAIRKRAKKYGIQSRRFGGYKRTAKIRRIASDKCRARLANPELHPRFMKLDEKVICDLYQQGYSLKRISQQFKVDPSVITLRLEKNGIHRRPSISLPSPNGDERFLQRLLLEKKIPYKFVGNGEVWIGSHCPDFINVNGQKKIIELLGRAFHDPDYKYKIGKIRLSAIADNIVFHYHLFGFKTLIIWDDELSDPSKVIKKIRGFEEL